MRNDICSAHSVCNEHNSCVLLHLPWPQRLGYRVLYIRYYDASDYREQEKEMKNINKHKTPQDKIDAWEKWRFSKEGCVSCPRQCRYNDPMRIICFNAYLHSTTNENKK